MKRLILMVGILGMLGPSVGRAVDGVYLGGQLGHVGLSGNTQAVSNNALGFGLDLGVRVHPMLDLLFNFQHSSHDANLTLMSQTVTAEILFGPWYDLSFNLGVGPGFYFFKQGSSETNFGLHVGGGGDIWIEEQFRVGVGFRWNGVFGGTIGDSYWTAMMRLGYMFEL